MPSTLEAARLAALRSLNVSATRQSIFQAIVSCAAYACETPVAAICFGGPSLLHVQAAVGIGSEYLELPRSGSLSERAIETGKLVVAENLLESEFCEHPWIETLGLRFAAAAPIVLSNGIAVGTLFIFGREPRAFSDTQRKALSALRDEVVRLLEDRVTADLRPEYLEMLESATAFTTNGIGVYVLRPNETLPEVEYVNGALARRGGVPIETYKVDIGSFFSLGENYKLLEGSIAHARAGDETTFDCQVVSAHGNAYWIEAQVKVLQPLNEGDLRYMVLTRDITQRKHEESFRKLLVSTVEKEPDAVFIIRMNPESLLRPEFVYANDGFFKLTGYAREDVAAGVYPSVLGPETDRDLVEFSAERVLAGAAVREEIRLYRKNGESFWAEVHAHPLDEPAQHCVLIVRDITQPHAQRERLSLMSEALEQAADFVIITNTTPPSQGGPNIVYANKSYLDATGYGLDELVGTTWSKVISPKNDAKVWDSIAERLEINEPNYKEFMLRRADGSDFWVEFVGRPFVSEDGRNRYRIAIGRDITLRKRAANQISLLFAAIDDSRDPTTIYERNDAGELVPVYENAPAQKQQQQRLLHLLEHQKRGRLFEEHLLAGEEVRQIFADIRGDGTPSVVEFSARALQGTKAIEAAITVERTLAQGDPASATGYRSRLLALSTMLPAIAEATSTLERFAILRALLLDTFGAEIETGGPSTDARVYINADACSAVFSYAGLERTATWPKRLEDTAITAIRFCIEAAIEHEEQREGSGALF